MFTAQQPVDLQLGACAGIRQLFNDGVTVKNKLNGFVASLTPDL